MTDCKVWNLHTSQPLLPCREYGYCCLLLICIVCKVITGEKSRMISFWRMCHMMNACTSFLSLFLHNFFLLLVCSRLISLVSKSRVQSTKKFTMKSGFFLVMSTRVKYLFCCFCCCSVDFWILFSLYFSQCLFLIIMPLALPPSSTLPLVLLLSLSISDCFFLSIIISVNWDTLSLAHKRDTQKKYCSLLHSMLCYLVW